MSIDSNIKTVPTSDLLSFYKSVELLAQVDPIAAARLFRSPRVLFTFPLVKRNTAPSSIIYGAAIPANVFLDVGDAVDFSFYLSVPDADEAASFSFQIEGFEICNTGSIALATNLFVQGQIRKQANETLAMSGTIISDSLDPQIVQIFSAGTNGFDLGAPLSFSIVAASTDDQEAIGASGKLIFIPA